jgi:hypothetical protein
MYVNVCIYFTKSYLLNVWYFHLVYIELLDNGQARPEYDGDTIRQLGCPNLHVRSRFPLIRELHIFPHSLL